ncbi:MAG: ATP-binding protein [Oscillospiraceae bacterium]|jgi:hypothetical protein|nr:ATP-binding protein [Oscillospiraceae bacterium]
MQQRQAPKRVATAVLNSLKGGVVPRVGLEWVTVGRKDEIYALLADTDVIAEGGASFRFIVGRYGAGKSFLLQTIRNYCLDRDFVVLDCDLSPERRFSGGKGQGVATYKELVRNMSTKLKPEGGALALILERWLSGIQTQTVAQGIEPGSEAFRQGVKRQIFSVVGEMQTMVNGFDFGIALSYYYNAWQDGDDEGKADVLRWLRGEFTTKTEAKRAIGVNIIVHDENWYDFLKLYSAFLVQAGYRGMLLLIDELVNIYRLPNRVTRQYNYEKILMMYNDTLQGKAQHMGIIMGSTPQALEDQERGIYSYDALRSRLTEGRFAKAGTRDLLAPVIRLDPLSYEELYVLTEKLASLHAGLYGYESHLTGEEIVGFLKVEFERIGADTHITPREVIRDFIELLNITMQNPGKTITDILTEGGFAFTAATLENTSDIQSAFAEFEI